jgi:hypothetical protein
MWKHIGWEGPWPMYEWDAPMEPKRRWLLAEAGYVRVVGGKSKYRGREGKLFQVRNKNGKILVDIEFAQDVVIQGFSVNNLMPRDKEVALPTESDEEEQEEKVGTEVLLLNVMMAVVRLSDEVKDLRQALGVAAVGPEVPTVESRAREQLQRRVTLAADPAPIEVLYQDIPARRIARAARPSVASLGRRSRVSEPDGDGPRKVNPTMGRPKDNEAADEVSLGGGVDVV